LDLCTVDKKMKKQKHHALVKPESTMILYSDLDAEREGLMYANEGNKINTRKAVNLVFYLVLVCCAICVTMSVVHQGFIQYKDVLRMRDTAEAELRQKCCVISLTPDLADYSSSDVTDCHRILQEDGKKNKRNRCEIAEDTLDQLIILQWIMEMLLHYFPFARMSLGDYIGNLSFGTLGTLLANFLLKTLYFF